MTLNRDEKDVERQLTQEWEDTARQAQSSMERLGRLADHFRRGGWMQCARELEEALTTIQHEATREVRASTAAADLQRQGCTCTCCDHREGSDCACFCHVAGKCAVPANTVVYQGSVVIHRLELRGTPIQIETLVAQKCENLKNTIMAYVRGDLP